MLKICSHEHVQKRVPKYLVTAIVVLIEISLATFEVTGSMFWVVYAVRCFLKLEEASSQSRSIENGEEFYKSTLDLLTRSHWSLTGNCVKIYIVQTVFIFSTDRYYKIIL